MQPTAETEALQNILYQIFGEFITMQITREEAIDTVKALSSRNWKSKTQVYAAFATIADTRLRQREKTRQFMLCDCGRGFQLRHWIAEFYISRDELVKIVKETGRMITGIRIPSPRLWKMQQEWDAELEALINSDAVLSYVFRKKGRLGRLKNFLHGKAWLAYEQGQKELEKQYGLCDTCMGRGIYTILDTRTKVTFSAYCFCKRGSETKQIIDKYYVKKD